MNTHKLPGVLTMTLGAAMILVGCNARDYDRRDDPGGGTRMADTSKTTSMPAPMTDANIVAILDAANESDSTFGAMAVKKAQSSEVKQFARLMMSEHHALRKQGQDLAKKLGVTPQPPAVFDLPTKQQDAMRDLEGKSGPAFDKAYIEHEVDFHQMVMETAQKALGEAQNPELKNLIQKAAPVIQKHLDHAKEIQQKTV